MSTNQTPNTDGPSKAPQIDYALNEKGEITRTDKDSTITIGRYDRETKIVRIIPEWAKFRPAMIRFLNAEEVPIESIILDGDEPDRPKPGVTIPPRPKMTLEAGDKTPAVVEWYRKYKPAEYKARYGVIGEGTITKHRKEKNEKGETVSVPFEVDAVLAHRKTHLTEKVEAGGNPDDGGESAAE
jgi:hypothetical protein